MVPTLHVDFETRSTLDLKKVGVYKYARHPSTDIWCMSWAIDDGPVHTWQPSDGGCPDEIWYHVNDGHPVRAWNALFERQIWKCILGPRYHFPVPKTKQYFCTQAEAIAMGLPRALEKTAEVLNLRVKKDVEGRRLMMRMTRPRSKKGGKIVWWTDEARVKRLCQYCENDVIVERLVGKKVRRLSPNERKLYLIDQRINDRGVQLDVPLIEASQRIAQKAIDAANELITELTEGAATAVTQRDKLLRWLQYQNVQIEDLQKATVRGILDEGNLPPREQQVLEIRADAARTSVAKLKSMTEMAGHDGRARGLLLYHGAHTGRWTGRQIQPHNFPRGEIEDVERFVPTILDGDFDAIEAEHPVLIVVSSLLRGMICARPGNRLLCGDYAQIEARVLAWIAEQNDLVRAFAEGSKIYEEMAGLIYDTDPDEIEKGSEQRTVGKNSVLGAGYQMGPAKFIDLVWKQAGIRLDEETAEKAIQAYRSRYLRIVRFWKEINRAAIRATVNEGETYCVGRGEALRFKKSGKFLWCVLPSGRALAYALPHMRTVEVEVEGKDKKVRRRSLVYYAVDSYTKRWKRHHAYGGLLTENVVQAMSRDLMASAMLRLERAGYPVVLTVHDEILADVPNGHGTLDEFLDLTQRCPKWAREIPVLVEGWEGERYHKE